MGIKKAREIAEKFKGEWILNSFIPKVIENYNNDKQGYNYRMCSLCSLQSVMPFLNKEQVSQFIVPLFVKAMKDPIPNVRFCVAKIIHKQKGSFD